MGFYGIDPDLMREHGTEASAVAGTVMDTERAAMLSIAKYELSEVEGDLFTICHEVHTELIDLSKVAHEKANQIEAAANGDPIPKSSGALARLEAGLADGVGSDGLDGAQPPDVSEDVKKWLEANPKPSAADLRRKMEEVAATGDQKALALLSAELWAQVGSMPDAEAKRYLDQVGRDAVIVATELGNPPATGPIADALLRMMDQPGKRWVSPLGIYLLQALGIDASDYTAGARAALDKMSERGEDEAEVVWDAIINLADDDDMRGTPSPARASLLRALSKKYPRLIELTMNESTTKAQLYADLIAIGATDDELIAIQAALAAYMQTTGTPPAEAERAFALLYKSLRAAGHSYHIDWKGLAAEIAKKAAENAAKGNAGVAVVLTAAEFAKFIKRDSTASDRADDDAIDLEQRTAALTYMMFTDPEAASALIAELGLDAIPANGLTQAQWNKIAKAASKAKAARAEANARGVPGTDQPGPLEVAYTKLQEAKTVMESVYE